MRMTPRMLLVTLLVTQLVAACAGSSGTGPQPSPPSPVSTSSPSAGPSSALHSSPEPWRTAALTDVRSGAVLHLADLSGKVLFVEGVATWCPPCLEQQAEAQTALAHLDPTRVTWISLDIDPSEDVPTLLRYANGHGFPWTFAIASPELLRFLADRFGDRVLLPPETPVVVVAPDGTATLTEHGIKRADRLLELAHQSGG